MTEVVLEGVSKIYGGGSVAVDSFSQTVADGEFLVLVGPSGCGKSTTLRMVAGLEAVSAGSIRIGGRDVTNLPPKDRDIAMVFQNYALYPHMTVYANMAFGLKLRGIAKEEINRRVSEAVRILNLEGLTERLPKQLSGGQRQRVALGRAIVRKPAVFLFDEPLSNLDAKMRVEMRSEIRRLHSLLHCTVIYVTHDQIEAMTMGDRIVVMNAGRIQQAGKPLEIYRNPENVFVAGFIGTPPMNIVSMNSIGSVHRKPGFAHIGFRPETMTMVEASVRESETHLVLRGLMDSVELTGAEAFVRVVLTSSGETVIARLPADIAFVKGSEISLSVPAAELRFFR